MCNWKSYRLYLVCDFNQYYRLVKSVIWLWLQINTIDWLNGTGNLTCVETSNHYNIDWFISVWYLDIRCAFTSVQLPRVGTSIHV